MRGCTTATRGWCMVKTIRALKGYIGLEMIEGLCVVLYI
jgi:hypothetical protein